MLPAVSKSVIIALFCVIVLLFSTSFTSITDDDYVASTLAYTRSIPNIVHYTQLKKNEQSSLYFSFESFLSLYSAAIFFSPKTIFIHTDHNSSTIAYAATNGSRWTRKVLTSFPDIVKINYVTAPTHVNGRLVHNIEAKSDFVRWEALYKHGGLYIDWDVLPLRDIKSLRRLGFTSVVARQDGGKINPGCCMTKPRSALAQIMKHDALKEFDGSWERHSVSLVTAASERLAGAPNEVLILDQNAMAPTSWTFGSVDKLFQTHNETAVPTTLQVNDPTTNPIARWENRVRSREWEIDFSSTYLLHAFKARGHPVPGFKNVTVPYVLARDSNYALAAWPAVQHMLKHGVVGEDDTYM